MTMTTIITVMMLMFNRILENERSKRERKKAKQEENIRALR